MKTAPSTAVVLTVGGSDSGGGAGIQADLKTFHALGVFGVSVITCITAQNPDRISALEAVSPRMIAAQLDQVFAAFPVAAAKTGMLDNAAIIEAVADGFRRRQPCPLVVDPVLVASSGRRLLKRNAVAVLGRSLLPLAALVTPNLAEAEVLSGRPIDSLAQMREAALALAGRFGVPFLIKGGHLGRAMPAIDVLCDGVAVTEYRRARVPDREVHGTGCTFSAAIAAQLALGHDLRTAIQGAKQVITRALRRALTLGRYRALNV